MGYNHDKKKSSKHKSDKKRRKRRSRSLSSSSSDSSRSRSRSLSPRRYSVKVSREDLKALKEAKRDRRACRTLKAQERLARVKRNRDWEEAEKVKNMQEKLVPPLTAACTAHVDKKLKGVDDKLDALASSLSTSAPPKTATSSSPSELSALRGQINSIGKQVQSNEATMHQVLQKISSVRPGTVATSPVPDGKAKAAVSQPSPSPPVVQAPPAPPGAQVVSRLNQMAKGFRLVGANDAETEANLKAFIKKVDRKQLTDMAVRYGLSKETLDAAPNKTELADDIVRLMKELDDTAQ